MSEEKQTSEVASENQESVEEVTVENSEEVNESPEAEEKSLTPVVKKVKKHQEAKKLVEEARSIVEASENELQDCKLLLEEDLGEYKGVKNTLHSGVIAEAKGLLGELGHTQESESDEEESVIFEAKDDVEPIRIKNVSSGRFTGVILALLAGLVTLIGLVYLATEKLGITLDVSKVPDEASSQSILGWFGSLVGATDDATIGGVVLGAIVAVVMIVIYTLRVNMKATSNLNFAQDQMKETQKYITHKTNCKNEMDRVDAHIKEAISLMGDYEVVLHEQNAKLRRIRHFEGEKENLSEYHDKSIDEMERTQNMIDNISRFMITPMSEEGKLSGKSTLFLHSAKETMEKVVHSFS